MTITVTTLVSFENGNGPYLVEPNGGLMIDAKGDLFGTTEFGGESGNYGTVFELVNSTSGYTLDTLVNFDVTNGYIPEAGLAADANGDLFGTTDSGGVYSYGTVFELVKSASGYTFAPLYTFTGGNDGGAPAGSLFADANGDLFGTTQVGNGTVFELANSASGYTFNTLYTFTGGTDGAHPTGSLIADAKGDLFGTTYAGGGLNGGTVFELVKSASGYTLDTLYTFTFGNDGGNPKGSLVADANGDLFGSTTQGGAHGDGTVFEIANTGFFALGPPSISNVTPTVVEKSQTTVIGTVAPGVAGDTLTLTENTGLGTLSFGPVQSDGIQQVIYTAPASISQSVIDAVTYTINESDGASATGSANVQLDAGPSITPVTPSVVEAGQTTEIGAVTPGLVGDTLALTQTGGSGAVSLQLVNGVEEIIYTAPASVPVGMSDAVTYSIADQHDDAVATGSSTVPVGPPGDTIYVGTAGGTINVGNANSIIDGRAGNETIILGNGNDVVFAGNNDNITLGNGNDTIDPGSNDTIKAGNGTDTISTGANSSVTVGNNPDTIMVEDNSTVVVGNGQDSVTAGAYATITGGNGPDIVTTGANANITLGNGNNTVNAGANSTIKLGNGNDTVYAGASDLITLGKGNDTVAFAESPNPLAIGNETINGFNAAHDTIQFNPALANYAAVLADTHQVGANTVIQIDPTESVTLVGVTASSLTAHNFHFS